jgi:uncharacterized membrane protein
MDERILMLVLRLVHIVAGIFWVGATLVLAGFLFPAVRAAGQEGGHLIQQIMERHRLQTYLSAAGGLTILAGLVMYWRLSSTTHGAWARSHAGMAFGLGGLVAIIAAAIGGSVPARAGRKLGEIGQRVQAAGGPPSAEQAAEIAALQSRITRALAVVTTLLVIAAALMATARYL